MIELTYFLLGALASMLICLFAMKRANKQNLQLIQQIRSNSYSRGWHDAKLDNISL